MCPLWLALARIKSPWETQRNCLLLTAYWLLPAWLAFGSIAAATAAVSTAAVATTATTIAAKAAPATAATTAILTRFGFVDLQSAAVYFFAIELINGGCALFLRGHFDEAEAS